MLGVRRQIAVGSASQDRAEHHCRQRRCALYAQAAPGGTQLRRITISIAFITLGILLSGDAVGTRGGDKDDVLEFLCGGNVSAALARPSNGSTSRDAACDGACAPANEHCRHKLSAALAEAVQLSGTHSVGAYSKAPSKVAVCIAGSVRTFHHQVAYRTLRSHLLDALGQSQQNEVRLFAYLKRRDEIGQPPGKFRAVPEASPHHLRTALLHVRPDHVRFQPNSSRFCTQCAWRTWDGVSGNDPVGFANQLHQDYMCLLMIEDFEQRRGMAFTHVVRTRPDVVWYLPVRPPSTWPANGVAFRDWALFLPRNLAVAALAAPYKHYLEACQARAQTSAALDGQSSGIVAAEGYDNFLGAEITRKAWHAHFGVHLNFIADLFPMMLLRLPGTPLEFSDYKGESCSVRFGTDLCAAMGNEHFFNRP
eukprot:TRINITY_DN20712_c0_g1_i1.p1 TRINITY_DN20712_c0_g1~~TRINITY_DN20712_c0_g1_i1.p1  ORF type:complete len:444 (-),score=51.15 TRINITY_DN20712_c0_g1_i1:341-1606(-)